MKKYLLSVFLTLGVLQIQAQVKQARKDSLHHYPTVESDERAMISFKKGLGFNAPDTSFGINIRFRMQNRIGLMTYSGQNLNVKEIEARVVRLRLRFDGYIKRVNLSYLVQLSFSRGDMDWDNTGIPNIIRDAMIYYTFNRRFYMGFGLAKLPGNRETIISSGQLQFPDRSIANSYFSISRDFGFFFYYSPNIGQFGINLKGAISAGEGRIGFKSDPGLCYTGRIELLPFGRFKKDGDFLEGDIFREPQPRLSIGLSGSFNSGAWYTKGETGNKLFASRDLTSLFADLIFKYRGLAVMGEYMSRASADPFTYDDEGNSQYVYNGVGFNTQISYCFKHNWEIAARYSAVYPSLDLRNVEDKQENIVLGVTKYINRHLTKLQSNVIYRRSTNMLDAGDFSDNFIWQFQMELGI